MLAKTPANPPSTSASSLRYEAPSRMSPTSGVGVAVIFSTPTTNTRRARPLSIWRMPAWMAAEPVAQAFSTRVAGVKRSSGTARATREAWKSCLENPLLKEPRKIASISCGPTSACLRQSPTTSAISSSAPAASDLPNLEWAQPIMQAPIAFLPATYTISAVTIEPAIRLILSFRGVRID